MDDLTDRRTLLRSGVAGCVVGFAGCLGLLDDDSDDGDGNDSDWNETEPTDGDGTGEDDTGASDDPEPTLDSWPMYQYDAQNSGHAQGSGPTDPVEIDWSYEAEEKFRGAPAILDGTVYVGCDDEHIYAFDLEDGTVEWKAQTREPVQRPLAVTEDVVLASNAQGLKAYDRHTGNRRWDVIEGDGNGATPPVVKDGTVVVGSSEPAVYAIDVETGAQLWRREGDRNFRGPAAIASGTVYICDWTNELHTYDFESGRPGYSVTIDEGQSTGATVVDGVIYLGGDDGTLFALDANNLGETLWTFEANEWVEASPAIGDEHVYFVDPPGYLYAIDKETGELDWSDETNGGSDSAIAIVGETLYFGDGSGTFYGYDATSGTRELEIELANWLLKTPAVVEGTAVVADTEGDLFSLKTAPG